MNLLLNSKFLLSHGGWSVEFKLFLIYFFLVEGQKGEMITFILLELFLRVGLDWDWFIDFSDMGFIKELNQGSFVVLESFELVQFELSREEINRWPQGTFLISQYVLDGFGQ